MDLGTFHIDGLIVHDVPRRSADGTGDPITFSEVPSELGPELRNFFRERIIRSLGRQSFEVERDPDETSPVTRHIADVIADETNLVAASQDAARHLHASQTGVNPPGLLVVCRGTVEGQQCCAILKLEHEEAIRVEQTQRNGRRTFNVAHLRDLMLGQNTRVFKASLFTTSDGTADAIEGRVSDSQVGFDASSGVASFFLKRFLGCRLKEAPDVATRAFFEASQEWINTLPDPVKRGRYEVALIAQMHDQSTTVIPATFADQNLDADDRAAYREYLAEKGAPTARLVKNTRLIESRIKQMSILFEHSSVRVSGRPEHVDEYVRINAPGGDAAPVEILDQVKGVRGGR
ncbi:MAG: nucleoid-associated protein [Thermoleophilaceae bacterium]